MAKQTSNFRQETRAQQGKKANFTIFPILRFPKVIAAIKAAYVPTLMAPLKKQILAFFAILEWFGKLTIDGATWQILHFFQILRFPKVIAAIKAAYVPTLMAPLKKQILAFFGILEWLGKLTIDGATCYIGKFCTFFNFKVSQSYCGNQSSLSTYFDGPT